MKFFQECSVKVILNWSYKLNTVKEIIVNTISTYHISNLGERFNEALSRKTDITKKENNKVFRIFKLY